MVAGGVVRRAVCDVGGAGGIELGFLARARADDGLRERALPSDVSVLV